MRYPLPIRKKVKVRRRGHTRISAKNQATIPVDALRKSGLGAGDELKVTAAGPGKIVLARSESWVDEFAGSLPGVFPPDFLEELRDEWER